MDMIGKLFDQNSIKWLQFRFTESEETLYFENLKNLKRLTFENMRTSYGLAIMLSELPKSLNLDLLEIESTESKIK